MSWRVVAPWARIRKGSKPSTPGLYRPRLGTLEDRTLLSTVVFNEVQNQSPLVMSGSIARREIQPQGAGALTTTYFGTFETDIDMVNGTIQFIGTGNDFCAANTGNWAPRANGGDGTEPAIYGLQVTIHHVPVVGAIRDYHMEADTGGATLALYPNADGSFGFSSAQTITINAGTGTYTSPVLGSGPINLSGLSAPNQAGDGNLVYNGNGTFHITVPVSVTYKTTIAGKHATLHINGQIVGAGSYNGNLDGLSNRPAPGGILAHLLDGIGDTSVAVNEPNAIGRAPGDRLSAGQTVRETACAAPAENAGALADPATLLMSRGTTAQAVDLAFAVGMESSADLTPA